MKAIKFMPVLAVIVLAGCSAHRNVARDDVYYSPYNSDGNRVTSSSNGSSVTSGISDKTEYDYQSYYADSKNYENDADPVYQTSETVTDTNGVVYTTTETYYDADYAARIKRFGSSSSNNVDYYDDYYSCGGNTYIYYGYDTWNYGWGYPYYSFYSPSWYYNWYYPYSWYGWYYPHYYYGWYDWGWYDWGWHGGYHHHFDEPYNPGHNPGHGMGNYVAQVRHAGNNTAGSMSYRTPQPGGSGGRSSGATARPNSNGSTSRPTIGTSSS